MRTVWKYPIPLWISTFYFDIPHGARFLVAAQKSNENNYSMWFEIPDTEAKKENHCFTLVATGGYAPTSGTYLATVFYSFYVFHIYEVHNDAR